MQVLIGDSLVKEDLARGGSGSSEVSGREESREVAAAMGEGKD
jgi:hypothetical protein